MNMTHRVRIFALGIYLFCVTPQLGSVVPRQSHLQRRKEICDYILTDIKRIYPSKVNHGYYLLLSCCSVTAVDVYHYSFVFSSTQMQVCSCLGPQPMGLAPSKVTLTSA